MIRKRQLAIALQIAYWLMLVPMFVIGMYNYPSADDFSMTDTVYHAYVAGGGILTCIWEAMKFGIHDYLTYTGYFTSAALTAFNPAVFGEQYYVVVFPLTILTLTFAFRYMMRCILVKALGADKDLSSCLTTLALILMVQCMPQGLPRSEGFYWYSGTINYTFMFSMGMIYIGLLISTIYDEQHVTRTAVIAAILGFFTGGGNYLSSLTTAILSVVFLFYAYVLCKIPAGRRRTITIVITCMLIGFAISCAGPGNAVRKEEVTGMSAIPAILLCLHYTLSYCVSEWTTWPVLCILVIAAVIAYRLAPSIHAKCAHPLLMTVFAYGLVSANICPPIYAESNIGAGRLQALFYMQYIIAAVLTVVYVMRYVWRRLHMTQETVVRPANSPDCADAENATNAHVGSCVMVTPSESTITRSASTAILALIAFLMFGSALDLHVDHRYFTFSSAIEDLVNGHAVAYRAECEERRIILNDESITDAILTPFTYRPEVLFYSDIDQDPANWINRAVAYYYGKDSVTLEVVTR